MHWIARDLGKLHLHIYIQSSVFLSSFSIKNISRSLTCQNKTPPLSVAKKKRTRKSQDQYHNDKSPAMSNCQLICFRSLFSTITLVRVTGEKNRLNVEEKMCDHSQATDSLLTSKSRKTTNISWKIFCHEWGSSRSWPPRPVRPLHGQNTDNTDKREYEPKWSQNNPRTDKVSELSRDSPERTDLDTTCCL